MESQAPARFKIIKGAKNWKPLGEPKALTILDYKRLMGVAASDAKDRYRIQNGSLIPPRNHLWVGCVKVCSLPRYKIVMINEGFQLLLDGIAYTIGSKYAIIKIGGVTCTYFVVGACTLCVSDTAARWGSFTKIYRQFWSPHGAMIYTGDRCIYTIDLSICIPVPGMPDSYGNFDYLPFSIRDKETGKWSTKYLYIMFRTVTESKGWQFARWKDNHTAVEIDAEGNERLTYVSGTALSYAKICEEPTFGP